MLIKNTDIITIAGRRGIGKSYLIRHLISKLHNTYRIVIIDINQEYSDLKEKFNDLIIEKINFEKNLNEEIDRIVDFYTSKRNFFIVFEDADIYIDNFNLPNSVMKFIYTGRHNGMGGIFSFRRLRSIHKQILFNSSYFFIFQAKLPNDVEYIKKYFDVENEIRQLKEHEFVLLDNFDRKQKAILKGGKIVYL